MTDDMTGSPVHDAGWRLQRGGLIDYRGMAANSTRLFLASAVSTGLNVAAGFVLVRVVVPVEYGQMAYYLRAFGLTRLLATLGLGAIVVEDVSRYSVAGDPEGLGRTISTLGLVRVTAGGAVALVLLGLMHGLANPALGWAALASFAASLSDFASAVVQGLRRHRMVAALALVQPSLFLLGLLALAMLQRAVPTTMYAAHTLSFGLTLAAYTWLLQRDSALAASRRSVSGPYLLEVAKPVLSLFLLAVIQYLYQSLGTLVLGQTRQFEQAAQLSAVLTVVTMPATLGLLVVTALYFPELVAARATGSEETAVSIVDLFLTTSLVLCVVPTAVITVHPDLILRLLYSDAYARSAFALAIASPLALFLFVQQLLILGLCAFSRPHLAMRGAAVQLALAAAGSMALALGEQDRQVEGIALAYALAGLVGFLIHWRELKRLLPFKLGILQVPSGLLMATLVVLVGRLLGALLAPEATWLGSVLEIGLSASLAMLLVAMVVCKPSQLRMVWSSLALLVRARRQG